MAIEERYPVIIQAALEIFARRGYHQASTREIARAADLSLAGLYHYVGSKEELLFLVIDRALDHLLASLDNALALAHAPEEKLLSLIHAHLDFAFHHGAALKVVNRDIEALADPHRTEAAQKRHSYLLRGIEVLRALDSHGRSPDELLDAINLLLGMLNGIATRPFLKRREDDRTLTAEVGNLFLRGFLGTAEPSTEEASHVTVASHAGVASHVSAGSRAN